VASRRFVVTSHIATVDDARVVGRSNVPPVAAFDDVESEVERASERDARARRGWEARASERAIEARGVDDANDRARDRDAE